MKKLSLLALTATFAVPLLAVAQTPSSINLSIPYAYGFGIINVINGVLVPTFLAIAFIVFLWGVYKYFILGAADEKSRTDGRQFVLWGIIGFVVVFSVWGLIAIVRNTLGLSGSSNNPPPPTFNTSSGGAASQPQSLPPGSFSI